MELSLDDSCQLFFPGEVVIGVLRVHNIDELIGEPIVRVNGYTIVWKNNSKCDTEEYCLFFEDKAVMTKILPRNNLTTSLDLPREIYSVTYKFHFVLPDNLPPSYEVPFGHTRYKISANFNSHTEFTYFSVGQWVGLKKRANSVVAERKMSYIPSLCLCWYPVVKASFHIEQTQYLPGETVYLDAVIENNSWDDVIYTKAIIVQNTKYLKTHHILPIKYKRTVVEEMRGLISSGCNQVWSRQPLYIPPVIPTTKTSNNPFNFFEVEYKLKIHIVMKSYKEKTLFTQKLFIGNWDDSISHMKLKDQEKKPIQLLQFSTEDCQLSKLQNNDFKPKYVIYQTN